MRRLAVSGLDCSERRRTLTFPRLKLPSTRRELDVEDTLDLDRPYCSAGRCVGDSNPVGGRKGERARKERGKGRKVKTATNPVVVTEARYCPFAEYR
jgi:hypothetical protein